MEAIISHYIFGLFSIFVTTLISWNIYLKKQNPLILDLFWPIHIYALFIWAFVLRSELDYIVNIITILISIWSMRLFFAMLDRYLSGKKDRRYEEILNKWNISRPIDFFKMFVFQSFLAYLISFIFFVGLNTSIVTGIHSYLGLIVMALGMIIEIHSDYLLKKHLALKNNLSCRLGLWKYSRHPNYFGEWLFWLGLSVCFIAQPYGWLSLTTPLIIYIMLNHLSGAPLIDNKDKSSRTDIDEYISSTRKFFPIPR